MLDKKEIKELLKSSPHVPGVYRMLDKNDVVIYIGKAKDLKKRLSYYFQKNQKHPIKTQKLLEKTDNVRYTAVDSELEAMILETNLIKQLKPKYNILMKDDKNYVYIKITDEDFPTIQIVRKMEKDNAKYIGPKTSAYKVRETFKVLKKLFPFRHCGLDIKYLGDHKVKVERKVIKYPCIDYYINRCVAPCIGKRTPEEYKKIIKNVENFLKGNADEIIKDLENQMKIFAENKNFEKAAKTRDKIQKIKDILEKQKISDPTLKDKDIINYCVTQDKAYFNLFQIRDGKLIGQENFILSAKDIEEKSEKKEVLQAFLKQYYEIATDIPIEILIPHEIDNKNKIQKFIKAKSNKNIKLIIPKIGRKDKLLKMSLNNARIFADRNKPSWQLENDHTKQAALTLQKLLKLNKPLKRIECYDISHLSGTETVGSMIVFTNGAPDKSMYRKFKIRTVKNKPDDYKSMEEILTRRFNKISRKIHHKNYIFKKARKKDKEFIEKNNNINLNKTDKGFFILEKNKKTIGFIAVKERSNKVTELTNLWISENERGKKLGHKLLYKAIEKAKNKRIYLICNEKIKDYYMVLGFEEIKKIPKELEKHNQECKKKHEQTAVLVYDKNKHKKDKSFSKIPDLIIIDGGKGQLSIANKVLANFNLKIPHIAIAKKLEKIYIPYKKTPIILKSNNEALKLLQRARNEAHRFAISYQKQLHLKNMKSK
ncbi:excinuclease ABC subunit UvrC [Candidatus Peregrinibacteria bacterium]|nr:excinuclease ABC subunit UvrC [Candidatus Peregrinibacteria bacterium]